LKHLAILAAAITAFLSLAIAPAHTLDRGKVGHTAGNDAPRLVGLSARLGRVYDEPNARFRSGGLSVRLHLCDDGPPSSRDRFGLIRVQHRWGDRTYVWLFAREQSILITWDIHFETPECVRAVPWSSLLPAELPHLRTHPCYSVTVRVRDPGGRWSNSLKEAVKPCVR
jgi:hypothetical protein